MKSDLLIKIEEQIALGNIISHRHKNLPLTIYNYSRTCQYDKSWNDITLKCRSLVLDDEGNIVANSLPKFFNIEEHIVDGIYNFDITQPYEVFEKMDGSYIQLYYYNGEWVINSKGSFSSDHVGYAWEIIREKYLPALNWLEKGLQRYTYIFELIYPDTRIVCDYGDEKELYLLSVRDRDGSELNLEMFEDKFKLVPSHTKLSFDELKALNLKNKEGFVLKFKDGMRLKIKFSDYVELHKIITNISSYDIYNFLKEGKDISILLENTPDEFDDWVHKKVAELKSKYDKIDFYSRKLFVELGDKLGIRENYSKRDFAMLLLDMPELPSYVKSILFNMFDKKDYSHIIWKFIKPDYEKPFSEV